MTRARQRPPPSQAEPAVARRQGAPPLPPLESRELLGSAMERLIRHGEELYRLRLTRAGKLILTK